MRCPLCAANVVRHSGVMRFPHFFRCEECGGYYPRTAEATAYPETYFAESEKQTIAQKALNVFLFLRKKKIQSLLPRPDALVLDYGCGNGKLVGYLIKSGLNADGYDPSPGAVSLAQKNNLPVFSAIPGKKYDLIMFWHSLEHTDTPLAVLINVKKYLAPGGQLLIAVPNGDSWEARFFGKTWFCYDWPYHCVHFTPRSLRMCLERAGFRVTGMDFVNPEYTLSSAAQSFLNMFLPKNALYAAVANRRAAGGGRIKFVFLAVVSALLLIAFSPLILLAWAAAIITRRSAAVIATAQAI